MLLAKYVMNVRKLKMRKKILEKGLQLWRKDASKVSARNIARELGMSHSGVLYYFQGDLKDRLAEYAIEKKDAKVIAQLIASSHPSVKNMDKKTRSYYLSNM